MAAFGSNSHKKPRVQDQVKQFPTSNRRPSQYLKVEPTVGLQQLLRSTYANSGVVSRKGSLPEARGCLLPNGVSNTWEGQSCSGGFQPNLIGTSTILVESPIAESRSLSPSMTPARHGSDSGFSHRTTRQELKACQRTPCQVKALFTNTRTMF